MNKIIEILICLFVIVCLLTVYGKVSEMNGGKFTFDPLKKVEMNQNGNTNSKQLFKNPKDIVDIKINPPIPLSYKTKQEIYDLRKYYVSKSIFAYSGYQPSEEQFGQIEDNKPWMSVNRCKEHDKPHKIDGDSEESRFINNPAILVGLDFPFSFYIPSAENYCMDTNMPVNAYYDRYNNEIVVEYEPLLSTFINTFYQFKGLNALDFGYRYLYLDRDKSKNVVEFLYLDNVSTNIVELQDYIDITNSCGVEGGCNNGLPLQPKLQFQYKKGKEPIVLYLKLWKERPSTPYNRADINEKIVIKRKFN